MNTAEIDNLLGEQQRKKRRMLIVLLVVAGLGITLLVLLSPGNTFDSYRIGDKCDTHCGRSGGNPLICLRVEQGSSYCSRPCGASYPSCPAAFECRPLDKGSASAHGSSTAVADSYCFRAAVTLGQLEAASSPSAKALDTQAGVQFAPLTVRRSKHLPGAAKPGS